MKNFVKLFKYTLIYIIICLVLAEIQGVNNNTVIVVKRPVALMANALQVVPGGLPAKPEVLDIELNC